MRKWASIVDAQRRMWQEQANSRASTISRATTAVSDNQFNWIRDQTLENPYTNEQEEDDDETDTSTLVNSVYPSGSTGGGSTGSFGNRSRTNTMDSQMGRIQAPARFPMGNQTPALQVRTNAEMLQRMNTQSPGQEAMDSYFSPTSESPVSTRSSGQLSMQSGMYPFPRQPIPAMPNSFEDNNRYTAPAMPRQASRDGTLNSFPNRGAQRPSLPPSMSSAQSARMRSASSPDIQNPVGPRRLPDPSQPGVPDMPAFPAHYAYQPGVLSRTNTGSPASMAMHQGLPMRPNTQSPGIQQQRDRMQGPPRSIPLNVNPEYQGGPYSPPQLTRAVSQMDRIGTPGSIDERMMNQQQRAHTSPSMGPQQAQSQQPTQLKVKVAYQAGAFTTTLVVPITITYQTLKDRIDAKLSRTSNVSLQSGVVKLKYVDDGDLISIRNDEDVQEAFEVWKEQVGTVQPMAEVQLFVQ
jgi:cell division control protein 24